MNSELEIVALYRRVFAKYGIDHQQNMLMEECAELIFTMNKFKRDRAVALHLAEEMADVLIMIDQIAYNHDLYADIEHYKKLKLERLKENLKRPSAL